MLLLLRRAVALGRELLGRGLLRLPVALLLRVAAILRLPWG